MRARKEEAVLSFSFPLLFRRYELPRLSDYLLLVELVLGKVVMGRRVGKRLGKRSEAGS